jgi:uncharacterized membrane protein
MSLHPQFKSDLVTESAIVTPPAAVLAAHVSGWTLQDWVLVATLLYLGLSSAWLLWKWWVAYRTKGWSPKDGS